MEKFTLLLLFLSFFKIGINSQEPNLQSGLVAYYPFNGNTLDATGNNHHSTSNGISFTTDRFGRDGNAAYFDGQSNTLSFKGYPMASPNSTITFWVKPDAGTDTVFVNTFPKSLKIVLRIVNNGYRLEINIGSNQKIYETGMPVYEYSRYDFIAILYNANQVTFKVNNSETGGRLNPNVYLIDEMFPLTVKNNPIYYFRGAVDDVRIFSRHINAQEVSLLYNDRIKKLPSARIDSVYSISHDYARVQAMPIHHGDDLDILKFGICWSIMPNPDTSNFISTYGPPTNMTDLLPSTTYYVRAFAINSAGIGYSNEVNFTTTFLDFDTIYDIDGNLYKTVKIGNQTWMAENLKTTRYADGTPIINGDNLETVMGRYYFHNVGDFRSSGLLYTWFAASNSDSLFKSYSQGVQGVCPDGWHIPSTTDYNILTNYLGGPTIAGLKLRVRGDEYWYSDKGTNESGFSAKAEGMMFNYSGLKHYIDNQYANAYFWSSEADTFNTDDYLENSSYAFIIHSSLVNSRLTNISKVGIFFGTNVRCIKDITSLPPENNFKKLATVDSIIYNVYPNPASDVLYLSNTTGKAIITIYDTQSRVRLKTNVTDGKVNIEFLPKGIYFIHISDGITTQKKKFVK